VSAASPCVAVCVLEARTGWCRGCWRTLGEIAGWPAMSEAEKERVLALVAGRRAGAHGGG
jgi:uncharacterized protein